MAVIELLSNQMLPADQFRKYPIDEHGKLRMNWFTIPALTVAGDIGSTLRLCELPPGRVRVLPHMSRLSASAFGAARTLAVGHKAYATRPPDNSDEADNPSAFAAAIDVSAETNVVALSNVLKYDLYSRAGVEIYATVAGGTIPIGATLNGYIAFLYE